MFVRLTSFKLNPSKVEESRKVYNDKIVPVIKKIKGNENVMLLEPLNGSDDYISITVWKTKADAEAYEASGKYKEMVGILKGYFSQTPVLKSYSVA